MDDKKNLLAFVLIFIVSMAVWDYFFTKKPPVGQEKTQTQNVDLPQKLESPQIEEIHQKLGREEALQKEERLSFQTNKLSGSINLRGARLDDLTLLDYRSDEIVKMDSSSLSASKQDLVHLLSPEATAEPYYAEFGWVSVTPGIETPNTSTPWKAENQDTQQGIVWTNAQGVTFRQRYELDDQYMFTVISTIENHTDSSISLYPYSRIVRTGTPKVGGFAALHEGPLGYIDNKLQELNYEEIQKEKDKRFQSQGGWIGITDKYWLAALIPDQNKTQEFFFKYAKIGSLDQYQTGYYGQAVTVAPGQTLHYKHHFFGGAKVLDILDHYEDTLGIKHFDLAVDFGWFYFITKPFFYFLSFLNKYLGNFGLAILLMTVLLKLLFFPLANKSYRSMARMKDLQPKIERIKERYGNDKVKMNQELMNLYKKEKINPMAGCLPILIQIPIFFALYKVLFVSIEMRHAPFYGWISDLSAKDPTNLFNLFGLIPWDPPAILHIGIWPILMGLSMFIQQKLNPAPQDPVQAKMFLVMPIILTVMMANFPAGLVIYWTWSNILSIIQQTVITRCVKKAA